MTAPRRRLVGARSWLSTAVAIAVLGVGAAVVERGQPSSVSLAPTGARGAAPAPTTLVLYDTTGAWGGLGQMYTTLTANLMSRFGPVTSRPVRTYLADEMDAYRRVVYVGSTYGEPLPNAFLDDVAEGTTEVLWLGHNIWALHDRVFAASGRYFANVYGWQWAGYDSSAFTAVEYKGRRFTRDAASGAVMGTVTTDATKRTVLASAIRSDGASMPWAVRTPSMQFTYVGEMPYAYASENDRYVAFAGLLQDLFDADRTLRRRALVRIEDVGPMSDPDELRSIADYLAGQRVPFSVTVFTRYEDPLGTYNDGRPVSRRLSQAPAVVSALAYMRSKGGTLVMHGLTHQSDRRLNPYSGASADDFEFWLAHVDDDDYVRYDGPVPGDSLAWASGRMNRHTADLASVRLPKPTMMTMPHYAASAVDYEAARATYGRHYGRMLYFAGVLGGGFSQADYAVTPIGQFFPYSGITDVYGLQIVPENLGNVSPEEYNHHPPRLPADIVATAERNLALNDAIASFFYHPYLGVSYLRETVSGIKAKGYTFVAAGSL